MRAAWSARIEACSRALAACARQPIVSALIACALIAIAGNVIAAEWSLRPSVSTGVEYIDNLTLRARSAGTPGDESVWKSTVEGRARLRYRTERTDISLTPRLKISRFLGASEFDSEDYEVDLDSSHQTQRSVFALPARYVVDTAISSEFSDDNADLIRSAEERRRLRVAPSWTYAYTERTDVDLRIDYNMERSDDPDRTEFDYTAISAGGRHRLTERNELSLQLQGARFDVAGSRERVDSVSALFGVTHAFDETLSASANVGWVESSFRVPAGFASLDDERGILYGAGLRKELPRTRFEAELARRLVPTASAGLVRRDQVTVSAVRELSEKVTGRLDFRFFRRRPLVENASVDRDFARLRVNLTYRLNREWSLDWGYRYSWQLDDDTERAKGNAVLVRLRWQGGTQAISR